MSLFKCVSFSYSKCSKTFTCLEQVNDCFAPLYCIIKLWMKAHLLNDGSTGTFNSHCIALLVGASK